MLRRLALILMILACCVGPAIGPRVTPQFSMLNAMPYSGVMVPLPRIFDPLYAQEAVTLTTPVSIGTRSTQSIISIHIEYGPPARIVVDYTDNLGVVQRDEHNATTTPTGATLLAALNTANLASTLCGGTPITACSLNARVIKHLQTEGKIAAGSVTGTPQ
jgi:hypothetical protein